MSEGINIPEENSNDEAINSKAEPANENILSIQNELTSAIVHQTSGITTSEIKNMETHAQELHKVPGHGWKHYFFEFFMLFLAVFCGFLAENWREHIVEKEREKQYIASLIEDLKSDQLIIEQQDVRMKNGIIMMDSLITILNTPAQIAQHTGELYYLARLAPRLQDLSTNSRTFEQLKNSGNFRLIRDLNISNKIMDYYERLPLIHQIEALHETEFAQYKTIAAKIFIPAVLLNMEMDNGGIQKITDNPALRTMDNELLQELSVFSVYMSGSRKGILAADEDFKKAGSELIEYLHKEYHLENE
jgi:hypothetical protein